MLIQTHQQRDYVPSSCSWPTHLINTVSACCRAQEEAEFREYASRPNVIDLIQKRIAPQIFGAERIKEAVACLLFGGSRKVFPLHMHIEASTAGKHNYEIYRS